MFDENFDDRKIIPFYLIRKVFGAKVKLHSNFDINKMTTFNVAIILTRNINGME